jgi:uncharacterized protein YjiS (DUF1127 family)
MTAIRFGDADRSMNQVRRHSALHSARGFAARVLEKLGRWRRRAQDRARLAALDDRMLSDIGISRAEAEFLGNRPFWRE